MRERSMLSIALLAGLGNDHELAPNAAIPLDLLACKFDIELRGRRSTLFENRLEGN